MIAFFSFILYDVIEGSDIRAAGSPPEGCEVDRTQMYESFAPAHFFLRGRKLRIKGG